MSRPSSQQDFKFIGKNVPNLAKISRISCLAPTLPLTHQGLYFLQLRLSTMRPPRVPIDRAVVGGAAGWAVEAHWLQLSRRR